MASRGRHTYIGMAGQIGTLRLHAPHTRPALSSIPAGWVCVCPCVWWQDPNAARRGSGLHHIFVDASNIMIGAQYVPNADGTGTSLDAVRRRRPAECAA